MNDPDGTAYKLDGSDEAANAVVAEPHHIGRYRVEKILGQGGFGLVYLAHDGQLQRLVAIKVPHRHRVSTAEDAEAYLTEARTVANLDHPHIVPVHDVGSTEDCPCFIVSKFIKGCTLAQKIKDDRPTFGETTELLATIAEALHYAHRTGLVHRDIKPGNILIDNSGKPFVVDFGLALKEENVGHGPRIAGIAGTPAYMSPEQARGEGHRVDGRSDIFSLGVVLYELLTGRRPFHASSREELLEQITTHEPRPPRQWDDVIPKELERICLKALAKRASERYTTAKDMADDLRHFLTQQPSPMPKALDSPSITPVMPPSSLGGSGTAVTPTTPTSDSQPIKIVPKGLRSFDAHDADFFLELLPGPRDRDGLPDSIRFWKTRIEEMDADNTFSVGLIYGPSGCGKSSLVKAGLLPRLSEGVIAVYVEATAEETEARLLNGLRKRCPALPADLGLKETLAALRVGQAALPVPGDPGQARLPVLRGKKVVIVLDQFEQWLHAKKEEQNTELVQALRQCDGGRVQCVVMVRDDFWMAATRFMRDLEVRLVEAQNSAAVDLFPIRHAEKVLAAFGRAFGVLPDASTDASKVQKQFLEQAVSGLAQEGKVISVRLALFAEMMKGKAWTPATLKAVGGTEGVGVTFLEETFSAATAPPEHRYHQKAARGVLKALLPESGTDIKGHMRSYAELLEASGYASRPKDFDELLRLDGEIRLITPTDPEGVEHEAPGRDGQARLPVLRAVVGQAALPVPAAERYYQLTHDYLVPSLRDWLTRKQRETRRGRAALRLAERAALWSARPENRHLPAWWEWANIRLLTKKKSWTAPQRKMMRKAGRYHALRAALLAGCLALLAFLGYETFGRLKAHSLRDQLLAAKTQEVPPIVEDMVPYRRWIDPLLEEAYADAARAGQADKQLHASLALLPADESQVDYLHGRLLDAEPHEVAIIREALGHSFNHASQKRADLVHLLWTVVERPGQGHEGRRLRAASALAAYDPDNPRWAKVSAPVVEQLVGANALVLSFWLEGLRPVRARLLEPLGVVFRDGKRRESERSLATTILADYAFDRPELLADLVQDADDKQYAVLFPKLERGRERVLTALRQTAAAKLQDKKTDEEKERLGKRQANAAVTLLRMGQAPAAWQVLKHRADPRARSYLIHRLGPWGADPAAIVKRLDDEKNVGIRRALLLALGEFGTDRLAVKERARLLPPVWRFFREDADAGVHGAAEWVLRQWAHADQFKAFEQEWIDSRPKRVAREDEIKRAVAKVAGRGESYWYVNGQGQTLVVIPAPGPFEMGSPPGEAGREGGPKGKIETRHTKRIGRTFAIAAKEVTVAEIRKLLPAHQYAELYSPTTDCPANRVTWYDAARYCNLLSAREGIVKEQWCYETNFLGKVTKLKENYLSLAGYRLPSEAEWEYACRAGAATSRYYGETEELLGKYAWYTRSSQDRWMLPGATLKPNDLGLFDMLGNALEWCQEPALLYSSGDDKEFIRDIDSSKSRVLRGGSFLLAMRVRSACRDRYEPGFDIYNVGFRAARTFTP